MLLIKKMLLRFTAILALPFCGCVMAGEPGSGAQKFAQLEQLLPTPNTYRTASGAPGHEYWQQQADYKINVSLDEENQSIVGSEQITYTNNSPDTLGYLWLQLDQNRFSEGSLERRSKTTDPKKDQISYRRLRQAQSFADNQLGYNDLVVTDKNGNSLSFVVVDTMMRIDLVKALKPGSKIVFNIGWGFNILDQAAIGSRGGFEHFKGKNQNQNQIKDSHIFFLAQWFPRMVAYTDYAGWQHKAFLGRGEFTLEFGNYEVAITVPEGHIVSATGELTNPNDVLTKVQRGRLAQANTSKPTFVVTPEEALANENRARDAEKTQTWNFKAERIRDFAWASSRKFIWDAMLHQQPGAKYDSILAMSFYPNEAEPAWSRYSTQAVIHTLDVYSRFSFNYPYPTAQSVNTWERGGMEYPMITFNGYRPSVAKGNDKDEEADGKADQSSPDITYSRQIKYRLIGVIIHEIGHIYFPMIVNSDERQWTWMDEGINTFLQYVAELEWEENYPAFRGKTNLLDYIPEYMTSTDQVPIMTQSDSILQFGPNAYYKPAAALTVLRETVMGRQQFDFAFKQYAERWKFKRPTPADFFRTMEDASGVDLDWFWRGWFYSTHHVDIDISDVREYRIKTRNPETDFPLDRIEDARLYPEPIMQERNARDGYTTRLQRMPELADFYNENDEFTVSNKDKNDYQSYLKGLEDWEKEVLQRATDEAPYVYFIDIKNKGGLVTPLPVKISYQDGSFRELDIPAEIWRRNAQTITHVLLEDKAIEKISIDDKHQTADADYSNNTFPPSITSSRLALYKRSNKDRNLMADMLVALKSGSESAEGIKKVPLTNTQSQ
jgi:hypothetical protein